MSKLLLIIIMCRVTIQLYYTNILILLLANGIEFPKRKGIYHRNIPVCTKMAWPNYEFSPNKTARYIGFVPHRQEWCDCRRWGKVMSWQFAWDHSVNDLASTWVRWQSGNLGFAPFALQIQLMPPAYADWYSQHLRKIEIKKLSAGTGERYWNVLLSTAFRSSIVHQA